MKKQAKALIATGAVVSLGLAAVPAIISATGVSGNIQLNTEVSTSIAMKIASPNDTNPDCMEQSGVTYGVANRYATSNGAEGSKQVDGFDGTEGGADELNTNTSCATLSMTPNTFDSTYSDVTIFTNSPSGYALTVQSKENTSPNLVNVADDTQYIEAGILTEQDGTGEQAGQKVVPGGQNKWAYKTDNGIITDWTAVTTSPAAIKSYDNYTEGGDTTRVTYGISAGNNPTGKYATELTYTATMFDGSNPYVGGVEVEDVPNASVSPSSLSIIKGQSKTIIITPETGFYLSGFTCPEGYECTGYTTDKDNSASAAAQTITIRNISASSTPVNISFTVAKLAVPLSDLTTMQQMTPDTVAETAIGAYKTLTDTRGGSYTVAKLLDGNIWMTQNLNLYNKTLTPEDSDVSSDFTIPNSSTANWCQTNSAACDNQSMALYSDNASYGTYYNWYTATAGTGTYEMESGNATSSICPKGWKLPTKDQFRAMYLQYGGSAAIRATGTNQPAIVLSGHRSGGSTDGQGSYGLYWASTADGSNGAYSLYLDSSSVYPQYTYYKWVGFSVRCVAAS